MCRKREDVCLSYAKPSEKIRTEFFPKHTLKVRTKAEKVSKNMDLGFLTEYYIPVVLAACLVTGYCIKHIAWLNKISNEYIPAILAILGAILACVSAAGSGNAVTLETVVYGAFTGLASTGLHQTFKHVIRKEE